MRCFLAFLLDEEARSSLRTIQHRLAEENIKVRWEPADKLHVTVRFLGDSPPDRLTQLKASLSELTTKFSPCDMVITTLGAFPSLQLPKVIWAGAFRTVVMDTLGKHVEELCQTAGWPSESREFHPHITLARVRERDDVRSLTNAAERINFDPILVRTSELVLMRSVLLPGGSQYSALASFPFNRSRSIP
jgi:2'-5' RNA ligase